MKLLIIGMGGIGSNFAKELVECVEQNQIDSMIDCTIADDDMVELKQIKYQNFDKKEVGQNKAKALAKRIKALNCNFFEAKTERIRTIGQLNGYDIIILCVDNDKTRKMVIEYCFKNDKEFIDLHATGRKVFAMPKETHIEDNIKFIDSKDMNTYSCQDKTDLEKGHIQKGYKIVAVIGVQMLLNLLRGHDNRTINLLV